jgi:hypothetical protein
VYDGLVTRAEYAFTDADFAGYTTEAITAFTLDDGSNPPYPGRINHAARTITVFVPPGTAVTGLTAAVTHAGLALVSDPATPDFTNPVTYTVTLEDGEDITYTVTVVSADTVTTAAELTALLSGASSGESSADPILVKITVDLTDGTDGWAALLAAIETGDKYVSLDLSDCTMAGMTGTPGEFYPGTADTGERYVTGLVLPDAAESIKERSYFANFISLTSLEASGVQTVGEYAFYGCTGLETVSLPAATTIGDYAIYGGCTSLVAVSLPEATSIGDGAFRGCTSLGTVSLPAATTIGTSAFYGCTGLGTVDLPAATGIGDYAFYGCTSLGTVSLPAAITIGRGAFSDCRSLESGSPAGSERLNIAE